MFTFFVLNLNLNRLIFDQIFKIKFMSNVQFIQITPQELAQMISEEVSKSLKDHIRVLQKNDANEEYKEFLSRKETSEYLGVSYSCIHEWSRQGILKPYKIGNRVFFKFEEIKQKLRSKK